MEDIYAERYWKCIIKIVDEFNITNVIRVDCLSRAERLGYEIDEAFRTLNRIAMKQMSYTDFYNNILHKYGLVKEDEIWCENIIRLKRQ